MERHRDLWEWVAAHNDLYTDHPYRGAYDAFYEASMQDIGERFAYDQIKLIGEIDRKMPEGDKMRFALWRLVKGDLWVDLAHEFYIPPSWLVRINRRILPDGALGQFTSRDRTTVDLLEALPALEGEQTVFAVDDTKDLHAVLTLLIGKALDGQGDTPTINLSGENQSRLAETLINPAPANDALKTASQSYDEADVTSR